MQQWSNWEEVFSAQFVRWLYNATTEELLGEAFSMWSVLRLCNEEQLRLRGSLEMAVRRVGCWCEMGTSEVELRARQLEAS
jgi:hypothetical protein